MVKIGSLRTYSEARKQLTRLIRSFHKGEIEQGDFRALVYAFSALLHYFKFEKDIELEQRIERLEQALDGTTPEVDVGKNLREAIEKAKRDYNEAKNEKAD